MVRTTGLTLFQVTYPPRMQGDLIDLIPTGLFLCHIYFLSSFKTVLPLPTVQHMTSSLQSCRGCCSSADLCSDNNRHLCTPLMDGGRPGADWADAGRLRKYYHNNTQSIFMLIQCNKPPKIILCTFNFLCTVLLRIFFLM